MYQLTSTALVLFLLHIFPQIEIFMNSKKHSKSKAFTLIELSVIILIIGIMLAGTFIGTRIIAKSRLAAAESLARSSPVPGIKDNMLWLETSLSASIDSSQATDGSSVTAWYDQSSNSGKPLVVAVGTGPTYANTINYVHAIKFVGSTANYLEISDASFLNGTDYTIMVLEKRQSSASNNYFLGETSSNPNDSLALGYGSDSTVIHAQGNQSYTTGAAVSSYASSSDKPRQFTFVHSSTSGNSTYINGILAAQDETKTSHLSGITSLAIGKGYTGEIGEIAIYARALKPEERQPIEDYAGKKWTRSINRASAPSGSCVGYTITESGCDLASATCNISQAGISATVNATSSSTSIACNQANYSGSVSYTCISGTASVTGSCTSTIPCTLGITGSSNASSVSSGSSGSITCDSSGYSGTVAYSCSSGTPSYTGTCGCASGYVASGSTCVLGASCNVSVTGVTTPATVAHLASGSLTCGATGYTGSVTYTCNNGTLSPTGACTCASGYAMSGGVCVVSAAPCTGGTVDTTSVAGSTIHKFTSVGSFNLNCPAARSVDVLVVAGGGGGGGDAAGGGGGGGVKYQSGFSVASGNTPVTVGAGGVAGVGSNATLATNGGNSVFGSLTAIGGGFGGRYSSNNGAAGGSGGGGACTGGAGGAATSGQGFAGATANSNVCGGGGGAGGAGAASVGGIGIAYAISGTNTYYGGGGGGGRQGVGSEGNENVSSGGGGRGAGSCSGPSAVAGTANTGGGGGGAPYGCQNTGAAGGSGIVIVRYVN